MNKELIHKLQNWAAEYETAQFPDDPVKGVFALFGSDINENKMKVKEMTISDVLQTVVFKNELGRLLSELDYIRKDARGFGRLRSHPIDRLKNDGVWNKTKFIEAYEQTMNKTSNYSKTVRTFILSVGGEAFNKTMKILLENEKKVFQSDGDNK